MLENGSNERRSVPVTTRDGCRAVGEHSVYTPHEIPPRRRYREMTEVLGRYGTTDSSHYDSPTPNYRFRETRT